MALKFRFDHSLRGTRWTGFSQQVQTAIVGAALIFAIAGLAILFGFGSSSARADTVSNPGSVALPLPLGSGTTKNVITPSEVCRYTKSNYPNKKGAAVLIKTHICDGSTEVCLKSLALISDKANALIQDNFVVFHSRFRCDEKICDSALEKQVRTAWNKSDSNPELIILNPRDPKDPNCSQPVFRNYLKDAPHVFDQNTGEDKFVFSTIEYYGPPTEPRPNFNGVDLGWDFVDFEPAYKALRNYLLANEGVRALLGGLYLTDLEGAEKQEMTRVDELRRQYPQPTRKNVKEAADRQLKGQ